MYDRIDMDPTLILLTIAANFKSKLTVLDVFSDQPLDKNFFSRFLVD